MSTIMGDKGAYYSIKSSSDSASLVSQLLVAFTSAGDPTFGCAALPRSPDEVKVRAEYKSWDGTASTHTGDSRTFSAYQVWEPKEGVPPQGDLLFLHGITDYGGQFAPHAETFL